MCMQLLDRQVFSDKASHRGQALTKHKDVIRDLEAALVHARGRRENARIRREASHDCLFLGVDVLTQSLKECCLQAGKEAL